MASDKQIVLITGANGGIGYGLAELLIEDSSKHVIVGSRSTDKGEAAVKELQNMKRPGSAEFLQLDVTDNKSIEAAVKSVDTNHGRLDALVNNAGLGASTNKDGSLADEMRQLYDTNVVGVQMVTDAFAPLLKKCTSTPRIINVSSGGGSIGLRLDPAFHERFKKMSPMIAYRSSKAALDMIHAIQAADYGDLGWKVFCYAPGFTVSNLGPLNTKEYGAKPSIEGARPMISMLNGEKDDKHGHFLESSGGEHPW